MIKIVKDKTTVEQWNQLLTDSNYLKGELEDASITGIFKLDFERVDKASSELGGLLLSNPTKALGNLEYALNDEGVKDVRIDLVGLAPVNQINIVDLRTIHLKKLSSVEGIVVQVTSVNPRLMIGVFQCQNVAHQNVVKSSITTLINKIGLLMYKL